MNRTKKNQAIIIYAINHYYSILGVVLSLVLIVCIPVLFIGLELLDWELHSRWGMKEKQVSVYLRRR